jgi:hypothetical protein
MVVESGKMGIGWSLYSLVRLCRVACAPETNNRLSCVCDV